MGYYRTAKDQKRHDALYRTKLSKLSEDPLLVAAEKERNVRISAGFCQCDCHCIGCPYCIHGIGHACYCSCLEKYRKGPHGKVKVARKANRPR